MNQSSLYDITDVCRMLGTTSRTLRFYEEKGLVHSTTVGTSARRHYTAEQITQIQYVLVLRALGLSVKTIAMLQTQTTDLKQAVLARRVDMYASIEAHTRDIHLLNQALAALESGKDILHENWQPSPAVEAEKLRIAEICAQAILQGDTDSLYAYLSPRMVKYMPRKAYCAMREDTLSPLGAWVEIERTVVDTQYSHRIFSYVAFEKCGLKITFVLYGGKIDGLWLSYYDPKMW